ncbi:uncharacterized protein J4E78_001395 [Alternaria triticimaculans]|uniref:uncharacterized protein n=1 Tax=Alternaria triticimaculans TaxID=297637 RepID=UPI0020C4A042|nr:uncharacterized protein J4E78_001395 [Alternaria triticimaculans]KAI4672892.1 hypothetical protein J4E78_001395 [Alternaria triticimaculans]
MKFPTLFLVALTTVASATPIISLELAERQIMTDNPTNICGTCALVIDLYSKVNHCLPNEIRKKQGACYDEQVCKAVKKNLLCKGACGYSCMSV